MSSSGGGDEPLSAGFRSYDAVAWCYDELAACYSLGRIGRAKASQVSQLEPVGPSPSGWPSFP